MTREEQERFDDYAGRSSRELAGMLIDLERAIVKLKRVESKAARAAGLKRTPEQRFIDRMIEGD